MTMMDLDSRSTNALTAYGVMPPRELSPVDFFSYIYLRMLYISLYIIVLLLLLQYPGFS